MKKQLLIILVLVLSISISGCSSISLKSSSLRLVVVRNSSTSFGSAVVYDQDESYYYLLTNHHVVTDASVDAIDYHNNVYDVEVIKSDASIDLAMIKIEKQIDLTVLSLADDVDMDIEVYSLGYPDSIYTKTKGEISDIGYIDYDLKTKVITHTAEIDHGSSGGALINLDKQIIGINFAAYFDDNRYVESYAIPLQTINDFINV